MNGNGGNSGDRTDRNLVNQRITHIEKNLSSLATTVNTLATTVKSSHEEAREDFKNIHSRLDVYGEKVASSGKVNWQIVLGFFVLIFAAVGGLTSFIILHTGPINEKANNNQQYHIERLKQLPDDYYQFGINAANIAWQKELIMDIKNRVHELEMFTSEHDAYIDYMREQLNYVDKFGSRKWNDRP